MKLHASLLLPALALACLPLRAQVPPSIDSTGSDHIVVPPSRYQMTLNHKPDSTPPAAEIAQGVDKFFKALKAGSYADAYEGFFASTKMGEQKEKVSAYVAKTQEAFGIYGALNDYELYDNYAVGKNLIILTYLSRHQMQPLRWRFVYYRPEKTWGLMDMSFDDVLD